jgi:hypothetical protein
LGCAAADGALCGAGASWASLWDLSLHITSMRNGGLNT